MQFILDVNVLFVQRFDVWTPEVRLYAVEVFGDTITGLTAFAAGLSWLFVFGSKSLQMWFSFFFFFSHRNQKNFGISIWEPTIWIGFNVAGESIVYLQLLVYWASNIYSIFFHLVKDSSVYIFNQVIDLTTTWCHPQPHPLIHLYISLMSQILLHFMPFWSFWTFDWCQTKLSTKSLCLTCLVCHCWSFCNYKRLDGWLWVVCLHWGILL